MDVYHKVLTKIYSVTDGRENADVDLAELLKKEGFFPSIDDIRTYMSSESWIAETNRTNIIRITHWGVAEAKRTLSNAPDKNKLIEKDSARLISTARELLVMAEELAGAPSEDKLKPIDDKISESAAIVNRIRANY